MSKDSIGNRMKQNYENRFCHKLIRRMPVILRLDGKAFHSVTRKCVKPFDSVFQNTMVYTAQELLSEIQGVKASYVQSDEISLLLTDYDTLKTDGWFDYKIQKICSVSAGMASAYFTVGWCDDGDYVVFDSRCFNIPKEEVCNYFIWRQQDWIKNSLQMYCRSVYSHKQLYKKNQADMHEMLYQNGLNWCDLPDKWKNGVFLWKNERRIDIREDIIFTKDREAIDSLVYVGE